LIKDALKTAAEAAIEEKSFIDLKML